MAAITNRILKFNAMINKTIMIDNILFVVITFNWMPVYDDRYIKAKIGAYGDNVYTNFSGLNVPEDDIEYKSFTDFSIGYLRFYKNKFYLQVYLENCAQEIVDKQMKCYLDEFIY